MAGNPSVPASASAFDIDSLSGKWQLINHTKHAREPRRMAGVAVNLHEEILRGFG